MGQAGTLVVLRGNSGSGKSTVARLVQERYARTECLVVGQDHVRRIMLRELEGDATGDLNAELLAAIARWGLDRGLIVLMEGILNARPYGRMLEGLASQASAAHFFAWDLSFEETVRRHHQRPQRHDFTVDEMAAWYHGWQPLEVVAEVRFDGAVTARAAADRVVAEIGGAERRGAQTVTEAGRDQ
jgi:predicted kinase